MTLPYNPNMGDVDFANTVTGLMQEIVLKPANP